MLFSKLILIGLFLSHGATSFAQSLPFDEYGFDSPVVPNGEASRPLQFSLLGPNSFSDSTLSEKIESTFAQVGCELSEVKIISNTSKEVKLGALSADCETPNASAAPEAECRLGFELVRISFVDSNLRLINASKAQSANQFCVRVSL